jgi:hypothetical protein
MELIWYRRYKLICDSKEIIMYKVIYILYVDSCAQTDLSLRSKEQNHADNESLSLIVYAWVKSFIFPVYQREPSYFLTVALQMPRRKIYISSTGLH